MLIVEGPDGSGKSTLCTQLSSELGWPIAPRVVSKDTTITGGYSSLMKWVDHNLMLGFQNTIFDRHRLISEPIYGPLFRGCLQDGFQNMDWFATRWLKFVRTGPIIIMCMPPLEAVMRNLRDDEENEVVRDKTPLVYWQYWALAARLGPRALLYDYTEPTDKVAMQGIIRTLKGIHE